MIGCIRRQSLPRFQLLRFARRQVSSSIEQLPSILRTRSKVSVVNSVKFLDLLQEFSDVEVSRKKLESLVSDGNSSDIDVNLQLRTLMLNGSSDQDIFQFIIKNVTSTLNVRQLETYVVSLIQKGKLTPATSLLHVLFDKQREFVLSHEAWLYFLTKVCELSHYEGASLIFHEIIDNYRFYDEELYTTFLDNNMVPFLIQPTHLEKLTIIFGAQEDTMAVRGLLEYFRRYYSFLGYWYIYKTMLINMVECFSKRGLFQDAMEYFNILAFRCSDKNSISFHRQDLLKHRAKTNARITQNNIRFNNKLEDFQFPDEIQSSIFLDQQKSATRESLSLYYPYISSNVYAVEGSNQIKIFQDAFEIDDLPQFHNLLTTHLQSMKEQSRLDLQNSIESISYQNHYLLQKFVISSLCDIDCHAEAAAILTDLPGRFPSVGKSKLYRASNFTYFFKTLYYKLESIHLSTNPTVMLRLSIVHQDVSDLFFKISHRLDPTDALKTYGYILQSMVMIPNTPFERVQHVLTQWKRNGSRSKDQKIFLEPLAYEMLKEQCIKMEANGVLQHIIETKD